MSTTERATATISLTRLGTPLAPAVRSRLSSDERRRAERIRHGATRDAFIAGRALARVALSRLASVDPRDWRFEVTPSGRPEVAAPRLAQQPRFNLSHTSGRVACVATLEVACGVDIESLDRRVDPLRIARHSFAPAEVELLSRLTGDELRERFFAFWTLKEAYLKALGAGIRLRLDAAAFELRARGSIHAHLADESVRAGWQFALFRPGQRHLLATAIASPTPLAIAACEVDLESAAARPLELAPLAQGTAIDRL